MSRWIRANKSMVFVAALYMLPATAAAQQPDYQSLQKALEQAQAQASRPGDERLSCDALQKELIDAMNSPEVKSFTRSQGELYASEQKRIESGKTDAALQAALTAFASIAPGGAWAQLGAAQAQMPMQRAQAAESLRLRSQQATEMMQVLPQILRGERVITLAYAQRCDWVPDDVMGSGAVPALPQAPAQPQQPR